MYCDMEFWRRFSCNIENCGCSWQGRHEYSLYKKPMDFTPGTRCQRFSSLSWLISSGSSMAELIPFLNVEQTFSSSVPPRYTDGMLKPK